MLITWVFIGHADFIDNESQTVSTSSETHTCIQSHMSHQSLLLCYKQQLIKYTCIHQMRLKESIFTDPDPECQKPMLKQNVRYVDTQSLHHSITDKCTKVSVL